MAEKAATVAAYLARLPRERRAAIEAVRKLVRRHLPKGYRETLAAQAATLKAAFKAAGKKADMGKSCIRFRTPDDLPLETIGELVAANPVDAFIARYEASRK